MEQNFTISSETPPCQEFSSPMLPKKKESHKGDSPDHQGASTSHIMSYRGEGCHPLFGIWNKTLQFPLRLHLAKSSLRRCYPKKKRVTKATLPITRVHRLVTLCLTGVRGVTPYSVYGTKLYKPL